MLEDSDSDVTLITRALKRNNVEFEYQVVDAKEEFVEGIDKYKPDAILSDHSLPQFNSLEAFDILNTKNLNIPFILVTGAVSEEFAVECLKKGVDDYIIKDHLTRLPNALLNALRQRKLEEEKARLQNKQCAYIEKIKSQNDELIKINQELDRFLYATSHELRGPVTSILGLIYLIELEIAEGRYENLDLYLDMAEKTIDKMLHTIEQLMSYSAIIKSEVKMSEIHIQDLYDSMILKLSSLEGFDSMKCKLEVEQSVPWIGVNNNISVILENIISNAIKYQDKRKKEHWVVTKIKVSPEMVLISIQDNGIGIAEELKDKIFSMFFRGSEISQGPGLGLFLVKEILDNLKGTIKVRSAINEGTTFTISIPNGS